MPDLTIPRGVSRLPERYQRRAAQIAERVKDIDALCVPCQPKDQLPIVQRMLGQLRPQPDMDVAAMSAEFKAACRDLPLWAISEAANDFLGGRVPNHTGQFMPTCAEFAKRAREIVTPFMSERAALRSEAENLVERAEDEARRIVIEIERHDPAVRLRAGELIAKFQAGQSKRVSLPKRGISPEKQARLDAMKAPERVTSRIGYKPSSSVGED